MEQEKNQNKFTPGERVKVSGYFMHAPEMMVDGYDDNGKVICVWFDSTAYGKQFQKHAFLEESLEKVLTIDEVSNQFFKSKDLKEN